MAALDAWHADMDIDTAARLLTAWAGRHDLTDAERDAVLDRIAARQANRSGSGATADITR
ncbi:hypothetical protein [Salinispora pacifica]|uniref:hypothetical protein n=1 Tax=Salinispora pacifica TaxID=351187 RepID=UPI0003733836|nr:hypothetical protein [Salinispora pacifica]